MKQRILILPAAALIIAGLVIYKLFFAPTPPPASERERMLLKQAPGFQLLDQNNQFHRLDAYRGRHRILVIFFDAKAGAGENPWLLRLQSRGSFLAAEDIKVFAISTALPQENRKEIEKVGEFPFPLLSDPTYEIPSLWGRFDFDSRSVLPALFFIDRAGRVSYTLDGSRPRPVDQPDEFLDDLLSP